MCSHHTHTHHLSLRVSHRSPSLSRCARLHALPSRQNPARNGTPCPLRSSTPPRCSFAVDLAYMVAMGIGAPTQALSPRTPCLALLLSRSLVHPVSPPVRGRRRRRRYLPMIGLSLEDAGLDHLGGALVVQLARDRIKRPLPSTLLHSHGGRCRTVLGRRSGHHGRPLAQCTPGSFPRRRVRRRKGWPRFELDDGPCFVHFNRGTAQRFSVCTSKTERGDRRDRSATDFSTWRPTMTAAVPPPLLVPPCSLTHVHRDCRLRSNLCSPRLSRPVCRRLLPPPQRPSAYRSSICRRHGHHLLPGRVTGAVSCQIDADVFSSSSSSSAIRKYRYLSTPIGSESPCKGRVK